MAGVTENGNDLWCSGKRRRFGENIQFVSSLEGTPLWVSEVKSGSFYDLRDARTHSLLALYKAARGGPPALADEGCTGAGSGVHTPSRPHPDTTSTLYVDNRTHNRLLRNLLILAERAAAELKQRWPALQYVTLGPSRIGAIAKAALVLNNAWR